MVDSLNNYFERLFWEYVSSEKIRKEMNYPYVYERATVSYQRYMKKLMFSVKNGIYMVGVWTMGRGLPWKCPRVFLLPILMMQVHCRLPPCYLVAPDQ